MRFILRARFWLGWGKDGGEVGYIVGVKRGEARRGEERNDNAESCWYDEWSFLHLQSDVKSQCQKQSLVVDVPA